MHDHGLSLSQCLTEKRQCSRCKRVLLSTNIVGNIHDISLYKGFKQIARSGPYKQIAESMEYLLLLTAEGTFIIDSKKK